MYFHDSKSTLKLQKKEYSAASNSRSIDEKASKRPVDASEIRDHLEIIKQREETNGISETDGILGEYISCLFSKLKMYIF